MAKHLRSSHNDAVGNKIRKLKGEGKTHNQALGQALGMARQGSLGREAKVSVGPRKRPGNPNTNGLWPDANLRGANPRKY